MQGFAVLANIALDSTAIIVRSSTLELVVKALVAHSHHAGVAEQSSRVFGALARSEEGQSLIARGDGLNALVAALGIFKSNATVTEQVWPLWVFLLFDCNFGYFICVL